MSTKNNPKNTAKDSDLKKVSGGNQVQQENPEQLEGRKSLLEGYKVDRVNAGGRKPGKIGSETPVSGDRNMTGFDAD